MTLEWLEWCAVFSLSFFLFRVAILVGSLGAGIVRSCKYEWTRDWCWSLGVAFSFWWLSEGAFRGLHGMLCLAPMEHCCKEGGTGGSPGTAFIVHAMPLGSLNWRKKR